MKKHEEIFSMIEKWSAKNPGERLLILNLDSHTDKIQGDSNGVEDYNWASRAEESEMAWVVHFPSQYRDLHYMMKDMYWRNPDRTSDILEQIEKLKGQYSEIWLTIDYDAFSTLKKESVLVGRPIVDFIMTQDEIFVELYELSELLIAHHLDITRIVPAESRDYLGVSERVKDRWIEGVTYQIKRVFGKKSKEPISTQQLPMSVPDAHPREQVQSINGAEQETLGSQ